MKLRRQLAILLLAGMASCGGGGGSAPIAPSVSPWPRFRHDLSNTGATLAGIDIGPERAAPEGFPIDDSPVRSSPVVAVDGTVYVATLGGTAAAHNADGSPRWQKVECEICPENRRALGPIASSPALFRRGGENTIFVGSGLEESAPTTDTECGRLYALRDTGDAAVCELCFDPCGADLPPSDLGTLSHAAFLSSPVLLTQSVTGNVTAVIAGAAVRRPGDGVWQGRLFAVSAGGQVLWTYPPGPTPWPAPFTASAALGSGNTLVIPSDDEVLHALSTTGTLLWTRPVSRFRDPLAVVAPSAITANTGVLVATASGEIAAISPDGRRELWPRFRESSGFAASMVLAGQPFLTPTPSPEPAATLPPATPTPDGTSPETGSEESPTPDFPATPSPSPTPSPTPPAFGSTIFAVTRQGQIRILDGRFGTVISTLSGETIDLGEGVVASPAYAADGHLVIASLAGHIHAINTASGLPAWPAVLLGTGAPIYSSPALAADGTIWVGSEDGQLWRIPPRPATPTPTASPASTAAN